MMNRNIKNIREMENVKISTAELNGLKIKLKMYSVKDFRGLNTNIYIVTINGSMIQEFTQSMGSINPETPGAFIETYRDGKSAKKTIIVQVNPANNFVRAYAYESEIRVKKELKWLEENKKGNFIVL